MIRLKQARITRGMNQTQLAKAINVSQAQISQYESGVNELSAEQIIKIAKVLQCTADYLLGLVDDKPEKTTTKRDKKN